MEFLIVFIFVAFAVDKIMCLNPFIWWASLSRAPSLLERPFTLESLPNDHWTFPVCVGFLHPLEKLFCFFLWLSPIYFLSFFVFAILASLLLFFFFFFACALGINNKQTTLLCILSIDLLFPLSCQLYFYFLRLIS